MYQLEPKIYRKNTLFVVNYNQSFEKKDLLNLTIIIIVLNSGFIYYKKPNIYIIFPLQ